MRMLLRRGLSIPLEGRSALSAGCCVHSKQVSFLCFIILIANCGPIRRAGAAQQTQERSPIQATWRGEGGKGVPILTSFQDLNLLSRQPLIKSLKVGLSPREPFLSVSDCLCLMHSIWTACCFGPLMPPLLFLRDKDPVSQVLYLFKR